MIHQQMTNKQNRRGFFKTMAGFAGLSMVAPALLNTIFGSSARADEQRRRAAPAAAGGGEVPLVDPKDPVAKAVKYVEDHTKSPDSKGNACKACGFYAKKEDRNGKEVGTCTIFANKVVPSTGWCASWNKKA